MDKKKIIFPAVLAVSLYISFQIFSDILSTKIAYIPFLSLAVDGGTIIYPLTFTVRDFVHKTLGKKISRQVVIIAAFLNLLMALLFYLVGILPPDVTWEYQDAYNAILTPVTRIVIASIIAEIISELIDTELFSIIYKKFKLDVIGVIVSNTFALVIDSVVFSIIAFFGQLPIEVVFQIIIANILIKSLVTLMSAPFIRYIPRLVSEGEM